MLCSNQQGFAQAWPFLEDAPPVLCEWLPWNHTFGGNATFNIVLRNGGTFYIDGGKPTPDLIAITARNPREISPTIYFNVPRGFDLLLPLLESDEGLRRSFFSRLDAMFYAGAALPQNLYDRLRALVPAERTGRTFMLSGWGSTETAPLATIVHFSIDRPANVGIPAAGTELKLRPSGSKLEARVRGPNVTPGYFRNDELTRAAFDEDGFYKIGDAMRLLDPDDPAKGLMFDGRVAEDFKLQSGTWVHAGTVRVRLIAACNSLVQDAVITGHDRTEVGAMVWLNAAAAGSLGEAEVCARLQTALASLHAESAASSVSPARLLVLEHPPSIDDGEITDKGYINQRAVLERRAERVEHLHAGGPEVIVHS
jgi:feruloyl-CoA synthase